MIFKILIRILLIWWNLYYGFLAVEGNKNYDIPVKSLLSLKKLNVEHPKAFEKSINAEVPKYVLADSKECFNDINRLCPNTKNQNFREINFGVLMCVQDSPEFMDISSDCNNLLWSYKLNLTQTKFFLSVAEQMCGNGIFQVDQCSKYYNDAMLEAKAPELSADIGLLLACLLEYKDEALDHLATTSKNGVAGCRNFLTNLGELIFSDYRLIHNFQTACKADILTHTCGRLETGSNFGTGAKGHSQGSTVECLSRHLEKLSTSCQGEVYRIAELQSDDFHLDRPLFSSCREDRERFCPNVQSGHGRVYACLLHHSRHPDMSSQCRSNLHQRENLMGNDYKVSYGLGHVCRPYVEKFCHSLTQGLPSADQQPAHFGLSVILVCLEGVMATGVDIDRDCRNEMLENRQMVAADLALSPAVVVYCRKEITQHCPGLEKDGGTLKCLMDKATPRFVETVGDREEKDGHRKSAVHIGAECWRELLGLESAVQPAQDFKADPWLTKDCVRAMDQYCPDAEPQEMLDCLLTNLNRPNAKESYGPRCAGRVLQLQFFTSRRFELDFATFRVCKVDAVTYCGYPAHGPRHLGADDTRTNAVMACLFSEAFADDPKVRPECASRVRRVMEARAVDVNLLPHIQVVCLHELSFYCSADVSRDKEVDCLQDNYANLSPPCQDAMFNFTRFEAEDYKLDHHLATACRRPIHRWCSAEMGEEGKYHKGQVLDCLVRYKDHPDTNKECRAHVSHHQIVALRDVRFSPAFWDACRVNARKFCPATTKKTEVLSCLSAILLTDTLASDDVDDDVTSRHRLSRHCRRLMKAELFVRNEDLELDPELGSKCKVELARFCGNSTSTSSSSSKKLECLRDNFRSLGVTCQKVVFLREEQGFALTSTDFSLLEVCGKMIEHFCGSQNFDEALTCLTRNRDSEYMDERCRSMLVKRQIEQSKDYRLNPLLVRNCRRDIPKYCRKYVRADDSPSLLEGNIIYCLKKKFAKKLLTHRCHVTVGKIIKESALDYRLDPELSSACTTEIRKYCSPVELPVEAEVQDGGHDGERTPLFDVRDYQNYGPIDNGRVGECLKRHLVTGHIKSDRCRAEVIRVLYESRADIHVDPALDQACHFDIPRYCPNVIPGEGRQMSCVLEVMQSSGETLTPECRKLLKERMEMWEYAIKIAPPGSVRELADALMTYHSKNYLLLSFAFVVTLLLALGCLMGRVTKRVQVDLKNR